MDCRGFDEVLDDLADGSLIGPAREEALAHRAGCTRCARELSSYEATLQVVARLRRRALPHGFFVRQRAAIMARLAPRVAWEAPPLCLVALITVTASLVAVGTDPLGAAFGDLLAGLVVEGARALDASATLLPVYLFLVGLAVMALREDSTPALSLVPIRPEPQGRAV